MAKSTKTPSPTPAPAAAPGKGPGVIAALIDLLQSGGGTPAELYDKLAERFVERASPKGGMRVTIAIQLKRLHKTGKLVIASETVEGRGTVYRADKPMAG